ncbi:hypothetical protein ACU4HD_43405 [Cupriavidus basilensis]
MRFALAQRPGASRRGQLAWMLVVWLALAGATLTKGLIGLVVLGLIGVAYLLMTRDWALIRRMNWLPGLAAAPDRHGAVVRRRAGAQPGVLPLLLHPRSISSAS